MIKWSGFLPPSGLLRQMHPLHFSPPSRAPRPRPPPPCPCPCPPPPSHDYREPISSPPWIIKTNAATAFQIHILFIRKWNYFGVNVNVSTMWTPHGEFRWNENCIWWPQIANQRKEIRNFLSHAEPMWIHSQFNFYKFILSFHHLFIQDCKNVVLTNSKAQSIGGPKNYDSRM